MVTWTARPEVVIDGLQESPAGTSVLSCGHPWCTPDGSGRPTADAYAAPHSTCVNAVYTNSDVGAGFTLMRPIDAGGVAVNTRFMDPPAFTEYIWADELRYTAVNPMVSLSRAGPATARPSEAGGLAARAPPSGEALGPAGLSQEPGAQTERCTRDRQLPRSPFVLGQVRCPRRPPRPDACQAQPPSHQQQQQQPQQLLLFSPRQDCHGCTIDMAHTADCIPSQREGGQDASSNAGASDAGDSCSTLGVLNVESEASNPLVRPPHAAALCQRSQALSDWRGLADAVAKRPASVCSSSDEQLESVLRRIPLRVMEPP